MIELTFFWFLDSVCTVPSYIIHLLFVFRFDICYFSLLIIFSIKQALKTEATCYLYLASISEKYSGLTTTELWKVCSDSMSPPKLRKQER